MGRSLVNVGSIANDGTGDSIRAAYSLINTNLIALWNNDAEARVARAISMTTTAPPGSPTEGDAYIVPAGATGAWSGQTNRVAVFEAGQGWHYIVPRTGRVVSVGDVMTQVIWTGSAWLRMTDQTGGVEFGIWANGARRAFVDQFGRFIVNAAVTHPAGDTTPRVQVHNTSFFQSGFGAFLWSNDNLAPVSNFAKSRGTTEGTHTLVVNNDHLGSIRAFGSDGSQFIQAATIRFETDGVPGPNDMPGRVVILTTPDGSSAPVEVARFNSQGVLSFAGVSGSGIRSDGASGVAIQTGNVERVRFTSTGPTLFGHTAALRFSTSLVHAIQVHGVTNVGLAAARWSADGTAGHLTLGKSRGAAPGDWTVVQVGDVLGRLVFDGADGTKFVAGASIRAEVAATPGADDMPARLIFATTPDGAAAATDNMVLDHNGRLMLSAVSYLTPESVRVGGSATIPQMQIHGSSQAAVHALLANWSATASSDGFVTFAKSVSGAPGTHALVGSGAELGSIQWTGDDGSDFQTAVLIRAEVDETPGIGNMPGRLIFMTTPESSASPVERMRIDRTGAVFFPTIGTTASAANAFLNSGSSPANSLLRSTSSIRYKTAVQSLGDDDLSVIDRLRPVTYRSKAEMDDPKRVFLGMIAEEVHEIDPRLVHMSLDKKGKPIPDGVMYDRLTVLLTAEVQRLKQRVASLEAMAA